MIVHCIESFAVSSIHLCGNKVQHNQCGNEVQCGKRNISRKSNYISSVLGFSLHFLLIDGKHYGQHIVYFIYDENNNNNDRNIGQVLLQVSSSYDRIQSHSELREREKESGERKTSKQNVRNYIIAKVLTSFALILSPTTFSVRQRIVTKSIRTLCVCLYETH